MLKPGQHFLLSLSGWLSRLVLLQSAHLEGLDHLDLTLYCAKEKETRKSLWLASGHTAGGTC